MSDRTVTFSELASEKLLEVGAGRPRSVLSDQYPSLPILRVADVLDGRIESSFQGYVPDSRRKAMGPKISKPGDVVLTSKGTVGRVALMPTDGPAFAYSPQLCYFRPAVNGPLIPRYLYYWFKSTEFWKQADALKGQTDMADYLSLSDIQSLKMRVPSLDQQAGVVDVLGSLDDKIATNDRIAATARALGTTKFVEASQSPDAVDVRLSDMCVALTRGITPKYTEDLDGLIIINQKCVRNGRVSLKPARKTLAEKVRESKLLHRDDVLVNSTGVGTLGRVARWTFVERATVDSHVTIVRFNPERIDPVCGGFAMLAAQAEIEALGEGSTGQTELGRAQLGGLEIRVPSREVAMALRPQLVALEAKSDAVLAESHALAELRDVLLPPLMSGEIKVREAEKAVEGVI